MELPGLVRSLASGLPSIVLRPVAHVGPGSLLRDLTAAIVMALPG